MSEQQKTLLKDVRELASEITTMLDPEKRIAYAVYIGMQAGKKLLNRRTERPIKIAIRRYINGSCH